MAAISVPNDSTMWFTGDTFRQKTGTQWWNTVNDFWKNIKGIGTLNSTIDFTTKNPLALRILTNGSSTKNAVNLFDPGTYDIASFGGSYIYSANGCYNDIADGGISVSNFPSLTSLFFGITTGANPLISGTQPYGTSGYKMGVQTAGNVFGIFNFPNDIRFSTRGNNAQITNDDFAIGDYCVNQTSAGKTEGIVRGAKVVDYTETTYGSFSGNIYIGGINNGGGSNLDTSLQRMDYYFGSELTPTEYAMWSTITNAYLTAWGCSMGVMDVHGDSILTNIGVAVGDRISDLVGAGKNWSVRNYARSGTTLENAVPLNLIDAPNFYDSRVIGASANAVKKYVAGYHKAILIGYGMNDIGLNYAGYNTTNFSTQDLAALDYINANQGWPFAKMVRCGNTLAIYPDAGNYYVTFYAVPVAADQTRDDAFRAQYTADSAARSGVINIDSRSIMDSNDLFGDGIHPDTSGCFKIGNNILSGVTGL